MVAPESFSPLSRISAQGAKIANYASAKCCTEYDDYPDPRQGFSPLSTLGMREGVGRKPHFGFVYGLG